MLPPLTPCISIQTAGHQSFTWIDSSRRSLPGSTNAPNLGFLLPYCFTSKKKKPATYSSGEPRDPPTRKVTRTRESEQIIVFARGSIHLNALKRRAGEEKSSLPMSTGTRCPLTDRFEQVSSAVEQSNRWVHQWALHNLLQPVNPHVAKQCEWVNLYTQYQ